MYLLNDKLAMIMKTVITHFEGNLLILFDRINDLFGSYWKSKGLKYSTK